MKTILFALALLIAAPAWAEDGLSKFQKDAILHYSFNYMSANVATSIVKRPKQSRWFYLSFGLTYALIVPSMIEGTHEKWEWNEWTAGVLGGVTGTLIRF